MSEPAATSTGAPSPLVDDQHPWLGLLPFKEEHGRFFFGRDEEITEILGRIRENTLTILFGQSGLGKSSLLAAAVMPKLASAAFAPVLLRLDHTTGAPSLIEQTRDAFRRALPQVAWPEPHALSLSNGDALAVSLWELFHRSPGLLPPGSPAPVLIFDQFEEIFTLGRQNPDREREANGWLEQMADLLQNRPPHALEDRFAENRRLARDYDFGASPLRVVFAMREDYLSHLEGWKTRLPLLTQNRMALLLLSGPQALDAVVGPASLGERPLVSREVAAGIVRTVARVEPETPLAQIKAVPPLLSLLCEQLNAARLAAGAAEITADMVTGQSQDILQRFYEESYAPFPPEHREAIRAMIEDPPMITEGGYRNSLVREDAEAELARQGVADARGVFDTLIQRRLITAEEKDRVQRLEVTHDVLVPLLVRSRRERRERVAQELAERTLAEEAAKTRKRRRLTAAMAVLSLLALAGAAYGFWQAREARAQEQVAHSATREAKHQASETEQANQRNLHTLHEASMADYATAVQRIDQEDRWREGVAHLARALKWEPGNAFAAARLYSTLSLYAAEKQNWPRLNLRHQAAVNSVQFSPDGSRIVTASDDKTARVWDAATGQPLGEPLRHEDYVWSAQFSPDGSRIVTASGDKTARFWDAATGQALGEPLLHPGGVLYAQFSANGSRIITATFSIIESSFDITIHTQVWNAAQVWDAATRQPLSGPLPTSICPQISPDGSRLVTVSEGKTARVLDATGKPLAELLGHEENICSAQFSADGSRIVTASWDKTARVWEAATGQRFGEPLRHPDGVVSAQFSPDGSRIVTASSGKTARVWDVATGQPLGEPLRPEDGVGSAQFSPDGSRVVTTSGDKIARVWDAATGQPLGEPLRHPDGVVSVQIGHFVSAQFVVGAQFSPDGSRVVTTSGDKIARVWDAATGQPLGEPLRPLGGVVNAQFSADGSRIVTAGSDRIARARVWNSVTGRPLDEPSPLRSLLPPMVEFGGQASPDGSRRLLVMSDDTVRVQEVATSQPFGEPFRHEGITSAQFSADGSRIITGGRDKTARVWDVATGKLLVDPLRHEDDVYSAQFSPDGSRIVTTSGSNTARVWESIALTRLPPVPEWMSQRASAVTGLRFSVDGELQPIPEEERLAILLAPVPGHDSWSGLARWLVLPAGERTVTPDSHFTRRQLAERERDTEQEGGLVSALRYDPTVPLARILLAGALLREEAKKASSEADPNLSQRAAFLRDYDLQRMPDDTALWVRAVRALHEQKDEERTRRALAKLEKLDQDRAAAVRKELGITAEPEKPTEPHPPQAAEKPKR